MRHSEKEVTDRSSKASGQVGYCPVHTKCKFQIFRMSPVKQYNCAFCERVYDISSSYYSHMKSKHPAEHKAKQAAKLKKIVEETDVVREMIPELVVQEGVMSETLEENVDVEEFNETLDEDDLDEDNLDESEVDENEVESAEENDVMEVINTREVVIPDLDFLMKTWHGDEMAEQLENATKKKETCVECLVVKEINNKKDMKIKAANKAVTFLRKSDKEKEQKIKELQIELFKALNENESLKMEKETERQTEDAEEGDKVTEEEEVDTKCSFCEFVGKDEKELKGHVKFEHLRCSRCPVTFFNMEQMSDHLLAVHRVGYFRCIQCDARFDTLAELEQCIKIHAREPAAPPAPAQTSEEAEFEESELFECPMCEEVSNTAEILQKHIAVEHPEKCDKCNFKSSDIEVVMKHMKAKHSPKELCTFFMKGKCTRKPCKFSHETTTQTSTVTQKVDRSQEPCKRGPQCSYKAKNRCYYFHLSWSSQVQKPKVQVQPRNVQFQLPNVQVQPPRVQTQPPRVQDQVPRGCDLSKPPPTVQKRRQPEGTHKKTQGLWCKFQEECRDGPLCRFRHFGPDPTTYTPTAQRGQMFL